MRVLEKSLVVLAIIGIVMTYSLASGGSFILLFSFVLLAALYFSVGFILLNGLRLRDARKKGALKDLGLFRVVYAFILGTALSIVCIGMLFKLLDFFGADNILSIGSVLLAIGTITSIIKHSDTANWSHKNFLWRLVPYLVFSVIILVTPKIELVRIRYHAYPDYIQARINYEKNPASKEAFDRLQEEYSKTIDLKE